MIRLNAFPSFAAASAADRRVFGGICHGYIRDFSASVDVPTLYRLVGDIYDATDDTGTRDDGKMMDAYRRETI